MKRAANPPSTAKKIVNSKVTGMKAGQALSGRPPMFIG